MANKVIKVKIEDLKKDLFVRTVLNQDHALMLGELLEAGTVLTPISITADMVVIDGRHRIEAHELNGLKEIQAVVVSVENDVELISKAFQANMGGALPPTRADIEHTIIMLLDRNVAQKSIADLLKLPPSVAKKYIKDVISKNNRIKMANAVSAVTAGGLNVAEAAEKYGIKPEKLSEQLNGKAKVPQLGIAELKRALTSQNKSNSLRNANLIKSAMDKYEDGDISEIQMRVLFTHLEHLQGKANRSLADWKARFEAKLQK